MSFNMPSSITQTSVTPNIVDSFVYGPEHQRAKQVQSTGKTLYYAGAMEKEVVGSATTVKTYVPNGIGVLIDNGSTVQTRYVHKDHLGSIAAITREDGSPAEQMSYDPFGKRRNLDGTDDPGNSLIGATDNKGYTGHEMLDNVALIHMNGRVYDPTVARFTSADPTVSHPGDGQSFNRYSYVVNNPLKYTDPTGYAQYRPVADSPRAFNWVGQSCFACAGDWGVVSGVDVRNNPIGGAQDNVIAYVSAGNDGGIVIQWVGNSGYIGGDGLVMGGNNVSPAPVYVQGDEAQGDFIKVADTSAYEKGLAGEKMHRSLVGQRGGTIVGSQLEYYEIDSAGNPVYRPDGTLSRGRMDALVQEGKNIYSDEVKNGRFTDLSKNQRALLPAVAEGRVVFFGQNAADAGIAGRSMSEVLSVREASWGSFRLWGFGGSFAPERLFNRLQGPGPIGPVE